MLEGKGRAGPGLPSQPYLSWLGAKTALTQESEPL